MEKIKVTTLENDKAITTLYSLFTERVRRTPLTTAYRSYETKTDSWVDMTWLEVNEKVAQRAHLFNEYGGIEGDRCAILSENSPGWVSTDLACFAQKLITVPLFYNDRPENIAHVILDSGATFLVVSDVVVWNALEPLIEDTQLKKVIAMDTFEVIWSRDTDSSPKQMSLPDNLATIIYTSGTTGSPKGVMLTHENILSNARGANDVSTVYPDDLFLSFLPLSHAFERTVGYYLPMMMGATVAFARSILTLQEDLLSIKPTMIITVPRMFEKVNARFSEKLLAAPAFKRGLVAMAEAVGYQHFEREQNRDCWRIKSVLYPLLDHMIGKKVRASLGGRLRVAVSGGAPLSTSIAKRFLGLGVPIIQGYGLTECSPVVCSNRLDSNDPASVGHALLNTEVMVDSESGELLVRGTGIMLGYWQEPEATSAAIDTNGWFHTGDIAKIVNDRIYITGRIKDILVLSNGEKLPPTELEDAISQDLWVDQVMVVGEGKPFLVALVVLSELGSGVTKEALLKRIAKDLHAFPGYEKIYDIIICSEPWTVEEGLLTPTMKLRRAQILIKYQEQVQEIYDE
ncbi:MAG: long-chain fatty acid--CoA ligase [Ghiorsea sp.]